MLQRYKGQNLYNQCVKSHSEAMSVMSIYLISGYFSPQDVVQKFK